MVFLVLIKTVEHVSFYRYWQEQAQQAELMECLLKRILNQKKHYVMQHLSYVCMI